VYRRQVGTSATGTRSEVAIVSTAPTTEVSAAAAATAAGDGRTGAAHHAHA
jgi:hypothetical protein